MHLNNNHSNHTVQIFITLIDIIYINYLCSSEITQLKVSIYSFLCRFHFFSSSKILGRHPCGVSCWHSDIGDGGLRHATCDRRQTGHLSLEGSCSLMLDNNSRDLVPIIDCFDSKWAAQPTWRCPYCPEFVPWFALVPLSAANKPIWSGLTATCPVTIL